LRCRLKRARAMTCMACASIFGNTRDSDAGPKTVGVLPCSRCWRRCREERSDRDRGADRRYIFGHTRRSQLPPPRPPTESGHDTRILAMRTESLLRKRRLDCGSRRPELAARAGVSRQLARQSRRVERAGGGRRAGARPGTLDDRRRQLYARAPAGVVAALGGPSAQWHHHCAVGRVGEQWSLRSMGRSRRRGGELGQSLTACSRPAAALFPGASPAGWCAGCDPALGVAEALLDGLAREACSALSTTTATALGALERESVHAGWVPAARRSCPSRRSPVVRWHLAAGASAGGAGSAPPPVV